MAKKLENKVDTAIQEKQSELTAIEKEIQAAAEDPERLVAARKKQRKLQESLNLLKKAAAAAQYTPPELSDKAELLSVLDKYTEEKAQRVMSIREAIATGEKELEQLEDGLMQTINSGDLEKMEALSSRKDELSSILRHRKELLSKAESVPTFPDGAIEEEYRGICKKLVPVWDELVDQLKIFADSYKATADTLIELHGTIQAVRAKMESLSGEYYSAIFTDDTAEDIVKAITIPRAYYFSLLNAFVPFNRRAV